MTKYRVMIHEGIHFIEVNTRVQFDDLEKAKEYALKCVDDALPNNTVEVLEVKAVAYFGGDGGSYFRGEE